MHDSDETAGLLLALREGDRSALDRLIPRLYDELRHLAHRHLRGLKPGDTLRTTDLVNEAYLKLAGHRKIRSDSRPEFLAIAASAMRQIIIDYLRKQRSIKRGGGWRQASFSVDEVASPRRPADLIELDEALGRLEEFDVRLREVVDCRVFGGMTVEDTAAALGVSPRTVDRSWAKAKAWLYREIHET